MLPNPVIVKGKSLITSSYTVPFLAVQRSKHSPSASAFIVLILSSFSSKDDSGSNTDIRSLFIHSFKTGFQYNSFKVAFFGNIFADTFIFKLSLFNFVEPSGISSIFLVGIKSFFG